MLGLVIRGVLDRMLIGLVLAYAATLALGNGTCRAVSPFGGLPGPLGDMQRLLGTVIDAVR